MQAVSPLTTAPRRNRGMRWTVLAALGVALVLARQAGSATAAEPCEELKKLDKAAKDAVEKAVTDLQAVKDAVKDYLKTQPASDTDELEKQIKDVQDVITKVTAGRNLPQKEAGKLSDFDQSEGGIKLTSLNNRIEALQKGIDEARQVMDAAKKHMPKEVQELGQMNASLLLKQKELQGLQVKQDAIIKVGEAPDLSRMEPLMKEIKALRLQIVAKTTELYSPAEMKLIFEAPKNQDEIVALQADAKPLADARQVLKKNCTDAEQTAADAKKVNLKILELMVANWRKSLQLGQEVQTKIETWQKSKDAANQACKADNDKAAEIEAAAAPAVQAAKDEAGNLDMIAVEIQKSKDLFKDKQRAQEKANLRDQAKRDPKSWANAESRRMLIEAAKARIFNATREFLLTEKQKAVDRLNGIKAKLDGNGCSAGAKQFLIQINQAINKINSVTAAAGGVLDDLMLEEIGPIDLDIAADFSDLLATWDSDWGPVTFEGKAGKADEVVQFTGFWLQGPNKKGVIKKGAFDPKTRHLQFSYYQDWNNQNGKGDLTLSEDGQTLSGTWTQGSGSGGWTMTHRAPDKR